MKERSLYQWVESLVLNNRVLPKELTEFKSLLDGKLSIIKCSEDWRLTNIARFKEFFEMPCKQDKDSISITIDSKYDLQGDNLPEGIKRMSKEEIIEYLSDKPLSFDSSDNILEFINETLNSNLIAIKIEGEDPKSIEISIPDINEGLISSRIVLIVGKGSSIEVIQVIQGAQSSSHSHLIDIFIEENGKVNHNILAIGQMFSKLLATVSVRQDENSIYSLNSFQEGWYFSRLEQYVNQLKGNAETHLKGLQIAKGLDELGTHSFVNFNGPGGSLNQINKAISEEESHSIFKGLINVPEIAQETQASQLSKNLLLSAKAKIDSSPQLKITADDVQCNHGATISQLDEEEVFYLQSRGISSKEANNLILNGFCKEIINSMPFKIKKWIHISKYLKIIN